MQRSDIDRVISDINSHLVSGLCLHELVANEPEIYSITRKSRNSHSDLAIVIQGPQSSLKFISFVLDRYRLLYPDVGLIISTWSDTPQSILSYLQNRSLSESNFWVLVTEPLNVSQFTEQAANPQIVSTKMVLNLLISRVIKEFLNIGLIRYLLIQGF